MSEMQRIRVVNPKDSWQGTEYYINGQKISEVKSVDFRVAVDEVPTFIFETIGFPDIDMPGNVRFDFTPETVMDAVKVLRNELSQHGIIYYGFLGSIRSAIKDFESGGTDFELSELILKRIIGEE